MIPIITNLHRRLLNRRLLFVYRSFFPYLPRQIPLNVYQFKWLAVALFTHRIQSCLFATANADRFCCAKCDTSLRKRIVTMVCCFPFMVIIISMEQIFFGIIIRCTQIEYASHYWDRYNLYIMYLNNKSKPNLLTNSSGQQNNFFHICMPACDNNTTNVPNNIVTRGKIFMTARHVNAPPNTHKLNETTSILLYGQLFNLIIIIDMTTPIYG